MHSNTEKYLSAWLNKKLSCRREAARCFVLVCSQLQRTYSAVFLLLVTVALRLLVQKYSIKFCSAVSYCLRRCPTKTPPDKHPLVCCRSWVGWGQYPASWVGWGQEYGLVSVFNKNTRRVLSHDVLRQQKTGLWPRALCPGVDLRLRRITSSSSQTLRRRLVRTTDDVTTSITPSL